MNQAGEPGRAPARYQVSEQDLLTQIGALTVKNTILEGENAQLRDLVDQNARRAMELEQQLAAITATPAETVADPEAATADEPAASGTEN